MDSSTTLLLAAHGSRHPEGNDEIRRFAGEWQKRHPACRREVCFIEHAFVLCRGALIEECHLPPHLRAAESEQGTRLPRGLTLAAMEELLLRDAVRRTLQRSSRSVRSCKIALERQGEATSSMRQMSASSAICWNVFTD